jgi:inward rectifier potassium channel
MAKKVKDPGTGTRNTSNRLVNKDGSFNVKRKGGHNPFSDLYYFLVNVSWVKFLVLVFLLYTSLNTFFAFVYLGCGVGNMNGIVHTNFVSDFLNCFFFSAQSLTTVGYGNISPGSHLTQLVASFEALVGVLNFALITGILYGRFSKPVARIIYSDNILIAPYEDGQAFMFRLANQRNNVLIKANVVVLYSKMDVNEKGESFRDYYEMPLEIDSINALPLSWTIVHPLNDKSPLWNKTLAEIKKEDGEIIIQFNAFDETFHETVHSRHSYNGTEVIENARFERAFEDMEGHTLLDLEKIGSYTRLEKASDTKQQALKAKQQTNNI